jgi:hypothetical protein
VGREGIEPSTNGLRGGARLYRHFVNQALAALANFEINVTQSQFGHSQFHLVTNDSLLTTALQSRELTPLSFWTG